MKTSKIVVRLLLWLLFIFTVYAVINGTVQSYFRNKNYEINIEKRVIDGEYSIISSLNADKYLEVYEKELSDNRLLKVYAEYDESYGNDMDGNRIVDHVQYRFIIFELDNIAKRSDGNEVIIWCDNGRGYSSSDPYNFNGIYYSTLSLDTIIEEECNSAERIDIYNESSEENVLIASEEIELLFDVNNIKEQLKSDGIDGNYDSSINEGTNVLISSIICNTLLITSFVAIGYFKGYKRFVG